MGRQSGIMEGKKSNKAKKKEREKLALIIPGVNLSDPAWVVKIKTLSALGICSVLFMTLLSVHKTPPPLLCFMVGTIFAINVIKAGSLFAVQTTISPRQSGQGERNGNAGNKSGSTVT